jgi:magnesium-transporting ATPase (P-type)
MLDAIKLVTVTAVSCLLAYLQPIHSVMFALFFIFFFDMIIGILTDLTVNKKSLSSKKFMFACLSFAIYITIIAMIYVVGERMNDLNEALFIDKFITYAFVYFYIVNSLKNLRKLLPRSRGIAFLEFIVGLEFVKRITSLGEFLKEESKV